ncbi:MAG: type II secretion system protein [bacterium]|jgi:general secretion pathway protein G
MRAYYHRAFTLIELLVVLAIVAVLLTLSVPRYFNSINASKEAILAENLRVTRETLDKYYSDKGRYPNSLEQLVEEKYLRNMPIDPMTERTDTWVITPPQNGVDGQVYDIRSGATGATQSGRPFNEL